MGRIWQWSVSLIYIILIVNDDTVDCQGVTSVNGPSYGTSVNQAVAGTQINQASIQGVQPYQQNSQSVQSTATAVNTNSIVSSDLPYSSPTSVPRPSTCCGPSTQQRLTPQCNGFPSIQLLNQGPTSLPSGCGQNQRVYQNIPPNLCLNNQPNLQNPSSTTVTSQASVNEVTTTGYLSDASITQANAVSTNYVQSNNIQPSLYIPQQAVNQYPVRPSCGSCSSPVRQPYLYPNPIGNCQCQQGSQIYPQQYNTVTEQSVATATANAVGQQNVATSQSTAVSQSTSSNQQLVPSIKQTAAVASAAAAQTTAINQAIPFTQQAVASSQAVASAATVSSGQALAASAQAAASSISNDISSSSVAATSAVESTALQTVASTQSTTSTSSTQSVATSISQQEELILNPISNNVINMPTKILLTSSCDTSTPSPYFPYPMYPPIQPIILKDSNKGSSLETWLPLFLVALLNDNGGYGGYGRC